MLLLVNDIRFLVLSSKYFFVNPLLVTILLVYPFSLVTTSLHI